MGSHNGAPSPSMSRAVRSTRARLRRDRTAPLGRGAWHVSPNPHLMGRRIGGRSGGAVLRQPLRPVRGTASWKLGALVRSVVVQASAPARTKSQYPLIHTCGFGGVSDRGRRRITMPALAQGRSVRVSRDVRCGAMGERCQRSRRPSSTRSMSAIGIPCCLSAVMMMCRTLTWARAARILSSVQA